VSYGAIPFMELDETTTNRSASAACLVAQILVPESTNPAEKGNGLVMVFHCFFWLFMAVSFPKQSFSCGGVLTWLV